MTNVTINTYVICRNGKAIEKVIIRDDIDYGTNYPQFDRLKTYLDLEDGNNYSLSLFSTTV